MQKLKNGWGYLVPGVFVALLVYDQQNAHQITWFTAVAPVWFLCAVGVTILAVRAVSDESETPVAARVKTSTKHETSQPFEADERIAA